MQTSILEASAFSGTIDLATEKMGGKALSCSDEFFAEKENLLKPGRGIFIPDKYTKNGKWMDGWESRRKRQPGYDWCIIKLGLPGVIRGVDIDTNHFLGNHPPYASLGACIAPANESGDKLAASANWVEIVPRSPLAPGSQNLFAVSSSTRWTHVRLNIYPDGGVARLKVYGDVIPDWSGVKPDASLLVPFGVLAALTLGVIMAIAAAVDGVNADSAVKDGFVAVVVFGAPLIAGIGALLHWAPAAWGRKANQGLSGLTVLALIGGVVAVGIGRLVAGLDGAPYFPSDNPDWDGLGLLTLVGAALLLAGVALAVLNLLVSVLARKGAVALDDIDGGQA